MIWKRILKYFFLLFILSVITLAFFAKQNTIKIYGGKTQVVDVSQFSPNKNPLCINNVNILNKSGDEFIQNHTICFENGLIDYLDSSDFISPDYGIIDGKGKFLIPGLIDSHVHLFKSPNDLLLYIANGVSGIREMIGEKDHLTWREEINNGRIGPDMYIASPRLGSFGKLEGWFMKVTQGFNNITNAKEAEAFVQKYADLGYNAVKIYSHLNQESYEAINKYAVEAGLDIVGHIPWSLKLSDVLNSNQSEIAHLEELMNALRREFGKFYDQEGVEKFLEFIDNRSIEIAKEMKANNISLTTTLWLTQSFVRQKFELEKVLKEVALEYENPGISEWDEKIPGGLGWLPHINRYKLDDNFTEADKEWQKVFWTTYGKACQIILKNLSSEGINIMAGTDANLPPTVPGFSLHDELEAMVDAGMTSVEVLQSATVIPSEWMGFNSGVIAPGYKANLLLLDANPLLDIANTKRINSVFHNGKLMDREFLDSLLESVNEANNKSRKKDISEFKQ